MNPKSLIPVLVITGAIGLGDGLATFFHKPPSTAAETSAANATLRGYFMLPELEAQGMIKRLGRGVVIEK
jgi:hypothetical protein